MKFKQLLIACAAVLGAVGARADINVGVIYSSTGPVSAAGLSMQRTIAILPKTLGGERVNYIGFDDGCDTSTTFKAVRKLVTEDKIDALLGPQCSANSLAIAGFMAQSETPMISMAGSAAIVEPVEGPKKWVFKTPQSETLMASIVVQHMAGAGVKTLGIIAFNDAYGEGWLKEMTKRTTSRSCPSNATNATTRAPRGRY